MEKKNNKQYKKNIKNAIIYQTLRNSIIFSNDNQNNQNFSFSTKLKNAANIIKFNLLSRCLKTKYPEKTKIKIYNKEYNLRNENEKREFESYLRNIIYFSYRNNYPIQKSYKNNNEYNSDCGWGCMIRSSQMILAKAIYEILNYEKNNNSILNTIILFIEYPINYNENIPDTFINFKLKIQEIFQNNNDNNNNKISKIYSPFSIKIICSIGQIINKTCGEWFSDVNLPYIFKIINKHYNIFPKLKIIPFQTNIIISKIIKKCFFESNEDLTEDNYFLFNNKKYVFQNYGLIFVSVRIGLNSIDRNYYASIKNLFNCNECIGFTGGKNFSATYFIGYDERHLLYLDPHFSQDSINSPLNNDNIESYLNKILFQLPIEKLQPAFTIGFLIRNLNEFKDLYKFFNEYSKKEYSSFFIQENESIKKNLTEEDKNFQNNEDDF